jgi:hypothetical protein
MQYDAAMGTSDAPTSQPDGSNRPIRTLLFVCNHNAGRSQMAQAFMEHDGPDDVRSSAAGLVMRACAQ